MLNITKEINQGSAYFSLEGRLDTITAPQLEEAIKSEISGLTQLTLDFDQLEYISSAGLRVLLMAQKLMDKQGKMTIVDANDDILEIFEVTGFSEILTIE
mgnify:CR=1 FL=1